ncbi:SDR family oxidoreductase, partial [Rhodoferax sp.]|uniref:SDR family NAD(P)-dependent oxidoreductase n=1 Tax=Rhodoferax sp. TaxID=50421 RepID=UPI0025F74E64
MSKLETRFPKKRALITGATTGFGEALAHALAERGWNVVVTGLHEDAIKRTVADVTQRGGNAMGFLLDVCDRAQWEKVRRQVVVAWGGIDLLVNNAGIADANKMVDMSDSDWDTMLSVNLNGVINGCRAYAPDMMAQKSG